MEKPDNIIIPNLYYLIFKYSLRSNDFVKDMFPYVSIYSTKWIVQEVNITILVDSSCHTHSLLLATTEVDSLQGQ